MTQPASPAYLRFPHLHGDTVAFTAEDDVWVAPLDGGRAWRVSADNVPVNHPRISPDGTRLAWTSTRDGAPEVHVAPLDGGPATRLTHWGTRTQVRGWTAEGEVLALSTHGQTSLRRTWARAVPLDGGPATTLPYGPVGHVAHGPHTVLLSATMGREAAWWKRYRGGTAGKLWIDREGEGEFVRLHEDLDGNLEYPLWVGDRVAFLSDHEGTGALYSSLADGSDLRRHTPSGASTPATRPPTAPVSSTPAPVSCGSSTTSTGPSRAARTSGSAGSASTSSPSPSTRPAGSAPPPPTTPAAAARSPCADPCTGSPTARVPPGRSPTSTAYAPGCPAPSAPRARNGWCG